MPKSFKIRTDRGIIEFGATAHVAGDRYSNHAIGTFRGTDLVSFFDQLPISTSRKPVTATLTNGNKITSWTYTSNGSKVDFYIEFEDVIKHEKCTITSVVMFDYKGSKNPTHQLPTVDLVLTNLVPGNEWGIGVACTDKFDTYYGSKQSPPYDNKENLTSWPREAPEFATNKWLYDFTLGSQVPVFPGPDNEDDNPGGDGDGEVEDDKIDVPDAPGITVADAGLLTLYTPTLSQIHAFGDFLWSDLFSLDTFKKLFADPMQAVFGLSIVPVDVPSAGSQDITIGNVSSGVNANRAVSQYVRKDCGTIAVKPVWNTALDFEPYTKFSIYLPFIGTRELKTDDIMGKNLNVTYLVDVLSGACTAHLSVNGSVLYQFSGSCATPVPLSSMNWNGLVSSMVQLAAAGIASAVTGGAAVPTAAGALTTAAGMVGNKPNIQRTGAVSGAAGMLGVKNPYLIRETPRQSLAKDYAHYNGYPSNITSLLNDLKGFTVVESMHLKNIGATGAELAEIEGLLKEGVLL